MIGVQAGDESLRIARGDADMLKSPSADTETSTLLTLDWFDSRSASTAASTRLAAIAAPRPLDALTADVQEVKSVFAALPPKLASQVAPATTKTLP